MLRIVHKGMSMANRIAEIASTCFVILILLVVIFFEPRLFDE
jgi:hypothetical protein